MTLPAEQRAVGAFLEDLAGRPPIETHISAVYVGEDTVWKLRRAVRLSFLDFSTLAERERTARRELELNAPNAPGMYRDVVPVLPAEHGGFSLGAPDADATGAVDWVLRMARVPEQDFAEELIKRDALTPSLLLTLADHVAEGHTRAIFSPRDQAESMRFVALGNGKAALAAGLDPVQVRAWLEATLAALAARGDWLRGRGAAGMVRRAHGDLHLGNICLWQGQPVPFDALEFDEDLATIDVGYDLAFLLMDLDVRVSRAAANLVLNRYVARTGDWDLIAGLPVFLSMRAMVRAHVEAAKLRPRESQAYLARALDYLRPAPGCVMAIGGLPGTGKSTLARAIAPEFGAAPGALVLRSDEIRKRQHGVAPEARLPQTAYSQAASRAVFDEIMMAAEAVAASGHAVIADATFLDLGHRARIAGNAGFLGIWLEAPIPVLEQRVARRVGDASDADLAVLRSAAQADPGARDWLGVDATDSARAADIVRAALRKRAC